MLYEIKHRHTGKILYSAEGSSLAEVVTKAVREGANLKGANLAYAYLKGANLKGTILSKANLDAIQVDYYDVLSRAPDEAPALLQALRDGKIDGSTYEGECACLVGTIAKVRKVSYTDMETLKPDSSRLAERWFTAIKKGDTPKTNPVAALVETWTEEWVRSNS